jgi:hypothetical protein
MSRKLSWLFAAMAYLVPPIWAYVAIKADLNAQLDAYGFIKCGTPALSMTLLACKASSALSLLAACFGIASFLGMSSPRPKIRLLEIGALLLPLLVAVCTFASVLCA